MNYLLQGNKAKDQIKVTVNDKDLMIISLSSFIKEADKFLNDKQDSVFAKSIDRYNIYGEAIEIQRDFENDDNLSIFVYCGLLSGPVNSTINELKSFVEKYR